VAGPGSSRAGEDAVAKGGRAAMTPPDAAVGGSQGRSTAARKADQAQTALSMLIDSSSYRAGRWRELR